MFIQNGENGLLVPVKDKDALRKAMEQMAADSAAAAAMGEKAQEIRNRIRLDAVTDQWLLFAEKICR